MDLATILGLAGGFGLVITAMLLGGSITAFVDVPSIMIVVGGTFAITSVCFSLREIINAQFVMLKTVLGGNVNVAESAVRLIQLAESGRKAGVLGLQKNLGELQDDPFLFKAMQMVVDQMPGEEVERILRTEVGAMSARHIASAAVLRKAAEIAPAMGLIGTLIGLVQMLGRLDDPSTIGPAMAVALLTTFYGAILGNMVFNPLASKLERNSAEEILRYSLVVVGAASIGRQENPRRLEMLINTMLPPSQRLQYFD